MSIDFGLGAIPLHEFAIACCIIVGIAVWRIWAARNRS